MATLIANATGNLTGVATFAAAEAGALAAVLNRNTTFTLAAASTVTSVTFTVTNLKVIDGALLYLRLGTVGTPTGTFKVDLQKGGVSQASVTVNKADLPAFTSTAIGAMCPVFFKFTGTATGDGGSNWTLVLTTTGTIVVNYASASGSSTNLTRALRTTTAATPAATNDLYVVGELTGAGTHNSYTVTMDSTAATAYGNGSLNSITVAGGNIAVASYGTLSYGTSASTNYILRVNGDLIVWDTGTLNIGSSGAEIPRTSSAVLEFQPVSADGDFGLLCLNYSTVNVAGLSRTSGKNVVKCKLTANVASSSVIANTGSSINANTAVAPDACGSLVALGVTDTANNSGHAIWYPGPSNIASTTQTMTVWLARGTGTNNRYVRVAVGSSASVTFTNGFYSDIDLQLGTAGTVTAVGNGTATSVSITAVGTGYLVRITGKCSSGTSSPILMLMACNASGVVTYLGDVTQNFIYDHQALVTAASISDTTFSVDADTGWLSGDAVCVASTTRTRTECQLYPLNANAGASSMVSGLYPFSDFVISTHSGTSPTQAEVGLLTRNVKIRSTSSTLMSYVYCAALATVTVSWAEFYYIGHSTTSKRGLEIDGGTIASAKSFTYCSIHDCDNFGFYCLGGFTSLNVTFSNNVMWNTLASAMITISGTLTNTDWTFDSNLIMRGASVGISLLDMGGTLTNFTAVGMGGVGISFSETGSSAVALGTFSNLTAHSGASTGITNSATGLTGTLDGVNCWRNSSFGYQSSDVTTINLIMKDLTIFGNTTANISMTSGDGLNIIGTSTITADTSFATTNGIRLDPTYSVQINMSGVDMSGVGGIYAPHTTNDLFLGTASQLTTPKGYANNCKFGTSPVFSTKSFWTRSAYIGFEKYGQTAGDHRCEMTYGQLKTDTTIFDAASPSMRMTPNSASFKLESAPLGKGILVAVPSGSSVTISVYTRKSVVGDGTAYNGNQPRLIQRANAALGQTADVVLDTHTVAAGSWEQLSATSSTATDDGAWEFIVDCDGTTGWINVDDWGVV